MFQWELESRWMSAATLVFSFLWGNENFNEETEIETSCRVLLFCLQYFNVTGEQTTRFSCLKESLKAAQRN